MKPKFNVSVKRFAVLDEIADTWQNGDFLSLLDAMEYGDTTALSDGELRELCIMGLQDMEPESAAALVLRHKLGDVLSEGQVENVAHDMPDNKMWEEYVNVSLHEQMFTVGSLLYEAFPGVFPEPDAVQVTLEVTAANDAAKLLSQGRPSESWVVRLLGAGMDEHSVLHRLYSAQLAGAAFPQADTIVWTARSQVLDSDRVDITVISSGYWLDPLRDTKSYESTAQPDEAR